MNSSELLKKVKQAGRKLITELEAKHILREYGAPVVEEMLAVREDEVLTVVNLFGYPVVIKGYGPNLIHKTDRGLVHLNLKDDQDVRNAIQQMAAEAKDELDGYLVQPQINGRREFVAGLFRDKIFGPVVMFGVGGIFTEAISDVVFRMAPLTPTDVEDMLTEIKSAKLLGSFRGEAAVDRSGLVRCLMALSNIAMAHPEIAEIDVNPLRITPQGGVVAVDAMMVIRDHIEEPQFLPPVEPSALGRFFHPRSIAFVGATPHIGKWGHNLLSLAISGGYKGEIYAVNPREQSIAGRPVFKSVADIPGIVDLAVVTIPAAGVLDLIPQFKAKGIRSMLVISSGFGETGAQGKAMENELVAKAREAGIVMVGPNTMGICNPHINLYCTGAHVRPRAGSTTVISQSGNLGTQLLAFAEQQGIGIRAFSGSGNEAMMTIEDYLDGSEVDPPTQIIMLYVESVKNGRRFFESARRIGKTKPIVLLKGGRTQAGHKAASTHTGAIASDVRVFDAVCRQAGVLQVDHPMDLLDLAAAFASLPIPKGNRAALMTFGGGWGVVTADLCVEHGLEVPPLSPELIAAIDKILPPYWSRANPIDIVGENDLTIPFVILEQLMQWDGCDAVINLGIIGRKNLSGRYFDSVQKADPTYSLEFLDSVRRQMLEFEEKYIQHVVALMEKYNKPVYGVGILLEDRQTVFRVPGSQFKGLFYPTPERAVNAFARMYEYRRFLSKGEGK